VGLIARLVASQYVDRADLEQVLADVVLGDSGLWLLWPQSRFTSVRVRRFVDLAVAEFDAQRP